MNHGLCGSAHGRWPVSASDARCARDRKAIPRLVLAGVAAKRPSGEAVWTLFDANELHALALGEAAAGTGSRREHARWLRDREGTGRTREVGPDASLVSG